MKDYQVKLLPHLMKYKNQQWEFKFSASSKSKYMTRENPESLLSKLHTLLDLFDIKHSKDHQYELEDQYFDDEKFTLKKNRCFVRKRVLNNGECFITVKSYTMNSRQKGIIRRQLFEKKFSIQECKDTIQNPEWIQKLLRTNFKFSTGCGKLNRVLVIKNKRTSIDITTRVGTYTLSFDRYYYFYPVYGTYSEIFPEIEIEPRKRHKGRDIQIEKLQKGIVQLFNYMPNAITKLDKGLEQANVNEIQTTYVIALDIVGYSKKSAEAQKQMIHRLGYFTKIAINEMRGEGAEQELAFLPTGDGMILLFDDRPETLLPIVINLQEKIKVSNRICQPEHKFEFRTGLHAGQVFRYSDVNENLNFAGNGINHAQRVMDLGNGWHILATREGFEALGNINDNRTYFIRLGIHSVKHGVELEVFNVFCDRQQIGNPVNPLGKTKWQ